VSRLPRWMHRTYARLGGYFWLPCPLCGQYFAGHEWRDHDGKSSVIHNPDSIYETSGRGNCPDCTRAGKGDPDRLGVRG
jgi:hypothetical protein